jgi:hypothetical protein
MARRCELLNLVDQLLAELVSAKADSLNWTRGFGPVLRGRVA